MKATHESAIQFPKIVDRAEWRAARGALLVKEKAATRARDALAAERRRLPMVAIEKEYALRGPAGPARVRGLFGGGPQPGPSPLHFSPRVEGWPGAGGGGG